jgi:hypothetical protein
MHCKDESVSFDQQPIGNYSHPQLGGPQWSTIPESIPVELRERFMLREGIRKKALLAQSVVYYVRMPASSTRAGCIKIGHTRDLQSRLRGLQRKYGGDPEVLATEPGDTELERRRQGQFSGFDAGGGYGEYIWEVPELLVWIQQVLAAWGPPMMTGPLPIEWPWPE